MDTPAPICYECKNYDVSNPEPFKCRAFPGGIPYDIIENKIKHVIPIEGDNGIMFEQK